MRLIQTNPVDTADDLRMGCNILTCFHVADGVTLNSMSYCKLHSGLALFNGLRHSPVVEGGHTFCNACSVWNILALKFTGSDSGHVHHAMFTLTVPMVDGRRLLSRSVFE